MVTNIRLSKSILQFCIVDLATTHYFCLFEYSLQYAASRLAPSGTTVVSMEGVERSGEGRPMRNTLAKIQARTFAGDVRTIRKEESVPMLYRTSIAKRYQYLW